MTTTITVDAHAGWPVLVVTQDKLAGEHVSVEQHIVEPNTKRDFYVHSTMEIVSIEEMALPGENSGTPAAELDLDDILSAVFPGIDFTVVQNGAVNYVELAKGGKKARTGIGSGTVGELIGRLNGLVKYLGG